MQSRSGRIHKTSYAKFSLHVPIIPRRSTTDDAAELQRFADRTGIAISVSHFPPGTSKWNKIEHRLFCHITENWRGRPLVDHETVVQLIGSVRTTTGLTVKAKLDTREYPTGIKVTDEQMENLLITRNAFHGDWNYTIHPRRNA